MTEKLVILRATQPSNRLEAVENAVVGARFETRFTQPSNLAIEIEEGVTRPILRALKTDATVMSVAPAMPLRLIEPHGASMVPSPPNDNVAWGVKAVGAQSSAYDGSEIAIGVLDTGIDSRHAAFSGVNIVERDFTNSGTGDWNGHGTHCAATILGRDVEGMRIGIARGVSRAIIGKVLAPSGGESDILAQAMIWAYQQGANILSMSLGIDFPGFVTKLVNEKGVHVSQATSIALHAYGANVRLFERLVSFLDANASFGHALLVVAATGNESGRDQTPPLEIDVGPPAASPGIIAVGALAEGGAGLKTAVFSNSGAIISAPGVNIVSARTGSGLIALSGTSMATPHVAGVAALWAQKLKAQGNLSATILRARVIASGTMAGLDPSVDPLDVGAGLVQAPQT